MDRREQKREALRQLDAWLLSLTPWQRLALTVLIVEGVLLVALALSWVFPASGPESLPASPPFH